MKRPEFDPEKAIGDGILRYDRQALCEFIIKLCERVKADVGAGAYHGGIFPENISLSDDGTLAIGSAKREDWSGQELEFLPPELYWNHRPTPASDVYSVGMLLYYAVTGGKLPFDGECRDAQLRRMGGEAFDIPAAAGRRLGDVIRRATRFKQSERFGSMDELRAAMESLLKNLYLNGAPSAETIFNKNDDDLSELERMMVGIIERDEEQPLPEFAEPEPEATAPEAEYADEAAAGVEAQAESESGDDAADEGDDFSLAAEAAREAAAPQSERVPNLYVEKNPELEPVVLKKQPEIIPVVQYPRNTDKERRMEEEAKKRQRRPVAVILILCAILVIVAIIFNAVIKNINRNMEALNAAQAGDSSVSAEVTAMPDAADPAETPVETVLPTEHVVPEDELLPITPDAGATPYVPGGASVTDDDPADPADPAETAGTGEHRYELFIEDISWTDAQKKCVELGGHLAVPNDAEEFVTLVELCESKNVDRVWLGGHRENGAIVWADGSTEPYEQWAKGEPSYVDSSDGAAEDYVLLWYNRGWYYNDSRNDPCAEFPQWYSGLMAYICEYGD